jgi:acyl-CoA thioesterase FadM
MDKVEFVIISETEHAIIDHGNGEFTSMPKSVYDQLKANEAPAE